MSSLTTDQIAALTATLTQMQSAYDNLVLGIMPTEIRDQNGELVKYAVHDPEKARLALGRRIITLQHQLGIHTGFRGPAHITVIG